MSDANKTEEKRRSNRINKIMDVVVSEKPVELGMQEILATCRNISRHGIQLELNTSYKDGELLYLRCFSNDTNDYLDIQCQVVWSSPSEESGYFNVLFLSALMDV